MPKRKISTGPQQMDCSDGAKMLIEQMKEHPEEFREYSGKFRKHLDAAKGTLRGDFSSMSKRDAAAIMAAADIHLYEVWLVEDVLTALTTPTPNPESEMRYSVGRVVGKSALNQMSGTAFANSVFVDNNTTAQYIEQVYRIEQEKYKAELEKLRREDHEHAMRNTKPFKDFL